MLQISGENSVYKGITLIETARFLTCYLHVCMEFLKENLENSVDFRRYILQDY